MLKAAGWCLRSLRGLLLVLTMSLSANAAGRGFAGLSVVTLPPLHLAQARRLTTDGDDNHVTFEVSPGSVLQSLLSAGAHLESWDGLSDLVKCMFCVRRSYWLAGWIGD